MILTRTEHALGELERTASREQGFDPARASIRQTAIWNDATKLLFSLIEDQLQEEFPDAVRTQWYSGELTVNDYIALSRSDSSGNSWLFRMDLAPPGLPGARFLAWVGYRSRAIRDGQGLDAGPAIFWSAPDPTGWEQWSKRDEAAPGPSELTLPLPNADAWIGRTADGQIHRYPPSELVRRIVEAAADAASRGQDG